MTTTATINIDAQTGDTVITTWTGWEPTPELRYLSPLKATYGRPVLQQRFVRIGLGTAGHVAKKEYAWQDVPTIYE